MAGIEPIPERPVPSVTNHRLRRGFAGLSAAVAVALQLLGPVIARGASTVVPVRPVEPVPVPDFRLRDENTYSNRSGQIVSPGDYRLRISVYYFGAAG